MRDWAEGPHHTSPGQRPGYRLAHAPRANGPFHQGLQSAGVAEGTAAGIVRAFSPHVFCLWAILGLAPQAGMAMRRWRGRAFLAENATK